MKCGDCGIKLPGVSLPALFGDWFGQEVEQKRWIEYDAGDEGWDGEVAWMGFAKAGDLG